MELRVVGVIIGVVYVFGWFMPMGYINVGDVFGQFFGAFGNSGNSDINNVSSTMSDVSQGMFGNTYGSISGQTIGGVTYLMLVAGAAFAVFSWLKNRTLLLLTSIIMLCLIAFTYFNYIQEIAWGLYLLVATGMSGVVYAFYSDKIR